MPDVIIAGGGLAGMAAAAALSGAGYHVTLFESRAFLGGRASSYPIPIAEGGSETIDNCQHILLRCCVNLLDFYRRLGVTGRIRFHRDFHFIEPGGRTWTLKAGRLPAPFHLAGSFCRLGFLSARSRLAILRALAAVRRQGSRQDLDGISMLDWLREQEQPPDAIARFWRPVLVSAVNEELDGIAAAHGFQVFRLSFLSGASDYEMGVPAAPLAELYAVQTAEEMRNVEIRFRSPVERFQFAADAAVAAESLGESYRADYFISALPFEKTGGVTPELNLDLTAFHHSPITGIHLWFDRAITNLAQAALLDRTIQWIFNKEDGKYLQLVVSASRSLIEMSREDVITLALAELAEFFPRVGAARLLKAHVIKELRATFSPAPGLESQRPPAQTPFRNFFLAGDWTRSGWPATMEGAVRSGYLAAEAVTRAAGAPRRFLLPDPDSRLLR